MTDVAKILIFDADSVSRVFLQGFFACSERYPDVQVLDFVDGYDCDGGGYCICVGGRPQSVSPDVAHVVLQKPVRLGAVLDHVLACFKQDNTGHDFAVLRFDSWSLDVSQSVLFLSEKPDDKIRVTEKERDILVYLYKKTNQSVSKDVLLNMVWGYADNIETHTLETHIYRLRQKIEKDPAMPRILVTTETGYRLNNVG